LADLAAGFARLPAAPRDAGTVLLIVRRLAGGVRERLPRAGLSVADGLPGDAWGATARNVDCQLTVMRHDIAKLLANGQPLTLFGDNLLIDLDISYRNLPPGTRLSVGRAHVVVTSEAHHGCKKFHDRFGADALRFTAVPPGREQNARGIHWRVLESGEVEIGSPIRVLSRPSG
jgi:hypothetical protein